MVQGITGPEPYSVQGPLLQREEEERERVKSKITIHILFDV